MGPWGRLAKPNVERRCSAVLRRCYCLIRFIALPPASMGLHQVTACLRAGSDSLLELLAGVPLLRNSTGLSGCHPEATFATICMPSPTGQGSCVHERAQEAARLRGIHGLSCRPCCVAGCVRAGDSFRHPVVVAARRPSPPTAEPWTVNSISLLSAPESSLSWPREPWATPCGASDASAASRPITFTATTAGKCCGQPPPRSRSWG